MEHIFGIDLGTTNSEIAYYHNRRVEIIEIENGMKYLPSVVGADQSGNIITGFKALNQYSVYPENTIKSIKRKMGSGETFVMAGREYTPAQISAEILKSLKQAAEKETGRSVKKAVITVPAYFTDIQRKETISAGELAGLDVVRIINEPTSAALAYGCRKDGGKKILVYDLGGGTFDVSIIDIEDDITEVIATDGDRMLGGDDFDQILENYLQSQLPRAAADPANLRLRARLKNIAEASKKELSDKTLVKIKEEFLTSINGKPVNLEISISRREFEDMIEEKLNSTYAILENTIKKAKIKRSDISKVLLVGGSTYIPAIFRDMREMGFNVHRGIDPAYCVAMGAAIQGAIIAGDKIDSILVDVNSHSLGIRCLNIIPFGGVNLEHHSIIIHKNTPVPSSATETYYTAVKDQRKVVVEVYQGESRLSSGNTFIGSFYLDNLPKNLPEGSEIDISFEYNINGIVEVRAKERKSGRTEKMTIDVNRVEVLKDTEKQEENTKEYKIIKEAADMKAIERILKTARKKCSEIDNEEVQNKLRTKIVELEDSINLDNGEIKHIADGLAELVAQI